ncbi:MAG: NAD(P)H-hydrate dehydratase [Bacteroidota bacterium]
MLTLGKEHIKSILKIRDEKSSKGDFGHALIVAGNTGKMGAALIAAKACLRSGVGLLTLNIPEKERLIFQTAIPEAMLQFRENKSASFSFFSTLGVGPGLGKSSESMFLVEKCISEFKKPMLLDADALNILSENKKLFKKVPKNTIITPQAKEFDRLFGEHKTQEERQITAISKAKELKIVIVLKGHKTLITSKGETFINITGNSGLAKGGSGDALSGIITAFLAQNYNAFDAAKLGVYIHGLAADFALENQSVESMLISDVISCLGKAFKDLRV